jgi:hypothetical protein
VKTPGQLDYEQDVQRKPHYHDGNPRKAWEQLQEIVRWTWERRHIPLTLSFFMLSLLSACTVHHSPHLRTKSGTLILYVDCGGIRHDISPSARVPQSTAVRANLTHQCAPSPSVVGERSNRPLDLPTGRLSSRPTLLFITQPPLLND